MSERAIIEPSTIPAWPRGVRLKFDEARERWTIVSPERVSVPNETAVEILRLIDGERTVQQIAAALAQRFDADEQVILDDAVAVLQDMADKGMLSTGG